MSLTRLEAPATDGGSIVGRLSLLYAVSGLVLGAAIGGALYLGLAREIDRQDRRLVASKIQVLEHLVTRYPLTSEAVRSEIEHEAGSEGPVAFALRVLDDDNRVLLETPGMSARIPADRFPSPHAGDDDATTCVECVRDARDEYMLHASWVPPHGPNPDARKLQVALDVSSSARVLSDYRTLLLVVIGLGILSTALVGAGVARVAVRPVRGITARLRAITASQLDQRLTDARPWPRELRGLAHEIDGMLARLEESFGRLGLFSAEIAHALRNPINNLRGEAEVALARTRTPEEYQQLLGSSLEEYDRLSRLIDALLFLARAEDPSRVIERSAFSARRELDVVRDFYDALASERSVSVACDGDAPLVADPTLVRRAISNLLANALNHTPSGGHVSMSARPMGDGGCEIVVRDAGAGIAAAHLPRVFERFYRVENPRAHSNAGAGLGLAVVRAIMRLHGGTADIESNDGQGTTVRLTFPPPKQDGGTSAEAVPPSSIS